MVREPAVAGQFYPADKAKLTKELDSMIPKESHKVDAIGALSPHAGYVYSGQVAGEVYGRLKSKETYVVISPNHTGYGAAMSATSQSWRTPLGVVDVNKELLSSIMEKTDLIKEDPLAHMFEHSIEVQLPFIQYISPKANIVPITVGHGSLKELEEAALAIASALEKIKENAMIIASSDMTHYESRKSAKMKDEKAIQKILALDAEGLFNVVEENDISMCGYIPAVMMLMSARKLGAKKGQLIKYSDSGDVTGDTEEVVGYAGIIIS